MPSRCLPNPRDRLLGSSSRTVLVSIKVRVRGGFEDGSKSAIPTQSVSQLPPLFTLFNALSPGDQALLLDSAVHNQGRLDLKGDVLQGQYRDALKCSTIPMT